MSLGWINSYVSRGKKCRHLLNRNVGIGHRHYSCRNVKHMKFRAIILSLLLLLPLCALHAQDKEKKPSFNGGDLNMFSVWVHKHKHYPEEAKKAGIEGRVYTAFTINKEGKLVNLRLLRGVHPLLDEEAIRVIESAPQIWKPGENRKGEPIDVNYTFPVFFKLVEE